MFEPGFFCLFLNVQPWFSLLLRCNIWDANAVQRAFSTVDVKIRDLIK